MTFGYVNEDNDDEVEVSILNETGLGGTVPILTHGKSLVGGGLRINPNLGTITVRNQTVSPHALGGPLTYPYAPARKFFVNYDQNALETATVKANIATYETYPFDGMRVTVNLDPHPLYGAPASPNLCGLGDSFWTTTALPWPCWGPALDNLQTTNFIKFQKNFLELKVKPSTTATSGPADWFNPEFERSVIHNFRMAARFCKQGFLRGVWFDFESLGGSVANYQTFKYSDRPAIYTVDNTFEDYQAKVEYWGRRIVEVCEEEFPGMEIQCAFLYSFATAENGTTKYGLLPSFIKGMNRAKRTVKVFEWGEEMYNRSGAETGHVEGYFLTEFVNRTYSPIPYTSENALTFSDNYNTVRASTAIRMDASPFDGNSTLYQTGLINHATYGGDEYVNVYQEGRRYFAGTATAAEVRAVKNARIAVGLDVTFDPALIPGLVAYIDPEAMGITNGGTITTFTDVTGNVWTGVGSPTYVNNAIGAAHGGINFVASSSQYVTCHSKASSFNGTDVPYTIIWVQDFATLPAGTVSMFSLGLSSSANDRISIRYTVAPLLTSQRVGHDGTSDIAFASTGAYTPTTVPTICAVVCNGALGATLLVNGAVIGYDPMNTIGAQSFDRLTLGALLQNAAASQFFDAPVGKFIIYNRALGTSELKFIIQNLGVEMGITVV